VIDEADNGREVRVALGEIIELRLPENRTTGFKWIIKSSGEPVCGLLDDRFIAGEKTHGGGGTRQWRLRAVAAGTAHLELALSRSWEGQPPARTFKITVRAGC